MTIEISDELINEIQAVLEKHDDANKDLGICIQYLSALIGTIASSYPGEMQQKKQIVQQLFQFAEHVLTENSSPAQNQAPTEEAYGVWKPSDQ